MSEAAAPSPSPAVVGYVEAVTDSAALGWAWVPGSDDRLAVELRRGEQTVGRANADEPRDDLARNGVGDGRHAFTLRIPDELRPHRAELRVVAVRDGETVPLDAPPSPDPTLARIAQLQRSVDMLVGSQRVMHRNLQAALLQSPASSSVSLADIAAAQASLGESIATFELFAVRLEAALAGREAPETALAPRRTLAVMASACALAFLFSCVALARTLLG